MAENYAEEEGEQDQSVDGALGILPPHLQTAILGLLPLQQLLQLRSLSRAFNSLLRSTSFLQHIAALQKAEAWFVMGREIPYSWPAKELVAFVPSQGKLINPLPGLLSQCSTIASCFGPQAVSIASSYGPFDCPTALGFTLCGSDGGLLCCLLNHRLSAQEDEVNSNPNTSFSILVFNPLTGEILRLPPPPLVHPNLHHSDEVCLSMHTHEDGHYSVVISREFGCFDHMEVYSSRMGCWKVAQPRHDAIAECTCSLVQYVVGGADILFWDEREDWLFCYNLQKDLWSKVKMSCDVDLRNPSVDGGAECFMPTLVRGSPFLQWRKGGRVLLATPLREAQEIGDDHLFSFRGLLGFAVHELQTSQESSRRPSSYWAVLAHTPKELWEQHQHLQASEYYYSFVFNGSHVCMSGRAQGLEDLLPLVYDLVHNSWYFLPSTATRLQYGAYNYVGLSSFQPQLNARPKP
ncbi:hypothetical protein GOP47_0013887 [Adiantum capillus-veneris]|uniref:F-box domain-containing protein n=1 Tax=Adiantum capillus-veneris TaxID=13818 RepID=A0A9D4ZG73_ADICA|nr:hypothetical protein GOP47_0013887 [Adiantum capillus-veneris]